MFFCAQVLYEFFISCPGLFSVLIFICFAHAESLQVFNLGSLRVTLCRVSRSDNSVNCNFSLVSFYENTLNRVESSFIFAFNKASWSVAFSLCLAAGLSLWPLRVDLLVACSILRSACSRLFLSGNMVASVSLRSVRAFISALTLFSC